MNVEKHRAGTALKAIQQAGAAQKNFPVLHGGLHETQAVREIAGGAGEPTRSMTPRGRWDSGEPMFTLIHPGALPDVMENPSPWWSGIDVAVPHIFPVRNTEKTANPATTNELTGDVDLPFPSPDERAG